MFLILIIYDVSFIRDEIHFPMLYALPWFYHTDINQRGANKPPFDNDKNMRLQFWRYIKYASKW